MLSRIFHVSSLSNCSLLQISFTQFTLLVSTPLVNYVYFKNSHQLEFGAFSEDRIKVNMKGYLLDNESRIRVENLVKQDVVRVNPKNASKKEERINWWKSLKLE